MPAGRSNAAALLQKVNSQLRGERVPLKTKEEDELAAYLSNLTVKTQQARTVNFEEYGDISISSGADASKTPRGRRSASPANSAETPAANKFLKKKPPENVAASLNGDEDGHLNNLKKKDEGIIIAGKKQAGPTTSGKTTSALDKAATLANKIKGQASRPGLRKHVSGDSESEGSIRGSEVGQRPRSADTSIGRDGQKFLKSRKTADEEDKLSVRSPSPQPLQRSLSNDNKKKSRRSSKSKGEIIRTLGNVYVTSDEESLAEFIQGLSASESTARRPQNLVAKRQQKWRKTPSQASRQSPSPVHGSRSPSPFKAGPSPLGKLSRSQSQDSDMLDSMASEILDEKHGRRGSVSSEDHFKLNLMDVASLLPATPSPPGNRESSKKKARLHKSGKSSGFDFQVSSRGVFKSEKKEKKKSKNEKASTKKSETSLFETLGVHMVDELIGVGADNNQNVEIDLSDDSEIKTERSDDRRKAWQRQESESEIITELGSGQKKVTNYRLQTTAASISERIGVSSPVVQQKSDYSDTDVDDYSESFVSESKSITKSESPRSKDRARRSARRQKSRDESYNQKHRGRDHKIVMEEKCIDISAADPAGGTHHWNTTQTGVRVLGPYGLQYVDPAPVATHVVSADALEALTSYSPNMMALQEMMKAQLDLVKNFVDIQGRIYQSCMDGLKYDFKYTTLEDTKEYIRKNRKPRLTFEEAVKLVEQEEALRA